MFSDVSAVFQCFPTVFQLFSDDVFRLLKSSSSWTKLPMVGSQLFSGWYQMILGVFRCSQLFSDVFRLFSNCFSTMFSDCWNPLQAELNYLWWVLSCSQDDIRWFRCFPMFSAVFQCFPTVFQLFSEDVFRLLISLQAELNYLWWVLSCFQDDIRCL